MAKEYIIEPEKPRTVKEFDPEEQPREKAEKYGCSILSIPELWALILRTGTPGMPITTLCKQLMADNNGRLHELERRHRAELRSRKGIGKTKSIQIEAVMEIMRRYAAEEPVRQQPVTSSEVIYRLLVDEIGNLDHEEIWLLTLNRRHMVTSRTCLTKGTATASLFDVKAAIKHAILQNADALVLAHNHPSGGLIPSPEDNNITRTLKEACNFMGLRLLDHLIVTANGYFSYNDQGRL